MGGAIKEWLLVNKDLAPGKRSQFITAANAPWSHADMKAGCHGDTMPIGYTYLTNVCPCDAEDIEIPSMTRKNR
jgi:hypothetical protein